MFRQNCRVIFAAQPFPKNSQIRYVFACKKFIFIHKRFTMRIILLFVFAFVSGPVFCQVEIPAKDYTSPGDLDVAFSKIRTFHFEPEGQKKAENLSYADVQGSPFWDINWNTALFVLANGNLAKTEKARLNLFTNEVHFINAENIEMACENKLIKKILFFKGTDTTKPFALFESFPDASGANNSYCRVLNKGRIRLLEMKKILVQEKEYNPLLGKKEYTFYSKRNYLIAVEEKTTPLPSLNQSGLLKALPELSDYKEWLTRNNNKLKTEAEVISFLNYYNSKRQ